MQKIKIAAATPSIKLADCQYNAARIIELMERAENEQVDLLVLSGDCIAGATCDTLRSHSTLLGAAKQALQKIVQTSIGKKLAIILGLYIGNEQLLCHFDIFAVGRGEMHSCLEEEIPLTINGYSLCFYPYFNDQSIIIDLKTSPEILGAANERRKTAKELSQNRIYVQTNPGQGESTTDHVYSGHNIIAQNGEILHESDPFGDGWAVAEIVASNETEAETCGRIQFAPTRVDGINKATTADGWQNSAFICTEQ